MTTENLSDRELLELAAKAAGMAGGEYSEIDGEPYLYFQPGTLWSSLADDGDALRLACDLGIFEYERWEVVNCAHGNYDDMRKAITVVAAQIGKEMP